MRCNAIIPFYLRTDSQVAAFVATVYHETDILRTFYQPIDGGAGAIHMTPTNLRIACNNINTFDLMLMQELQPVCFGESACPCATDVQLSSIVNRSIALSFLTAGWFFPTGARTVYGSDACSRLDVVASEGLGDPISGLVSYVSLVFIISAKCHTI